MNSLYQADTYPSLQICNTRLVISTPNSPHNVHCRNNPCNIDSILYLLIFLCILNSFHQLIHISTLVVSNKDPFKISLFLFFSFTTFATFLSQWENFWSFCLLLYSICNPLIRYCSNISGFITRSLNFGTVYVYYPNTSGSYPSASTLVLGDSHA